MCGLWRACENNDLGIGVNKYSGTQANLATAASLHLPGEGRGG